MGHDKKSRVSQDHSAISPSVSWDQCSTPYRGVLENQLLHSVLAGYYGSLRSFRISAKPLAVVQGGLTTTRDTSSNPIVSTIKNNGYDWINLAKCSKWNNRTPEQAVQGSLHLQHSTVMTLNLRR